MKNFSYKDLYKIKKKKYDSYYTGFAMRLNLTTSRLIQLSMYGNTGKQNKPVHFCKETLKLQICEYLLCCRNILV